MKTLCVCLFLLPGFLPGSDKNAWTLKKERDGMIIYNRHSEISKFNDIRVDIDVPGTVEQLAAILLDVDKYTDWVYATKSSTTMRKVSDNEVIYYSEIGTPWPATNRDFYADMKVNYNLAARSLNIVSMGMKDYQPEKKDLVRIPWSRGSWTVTTETGNRIHIQYILQADPGGSIPAWILNTFATKAPMETFSNLKRKMEELNK
jgi:hypothetical protein